MAATSQRSSITLKGSVDIITEFFDYAINSILYQRGIYPPESFTHNQHYGLTILKTDNEELKTFLATVLSQIKEWILEKHLKRLVIVIVSNESKETLERWEFKLECEDLEPDGTQKQKELKEIQAEIRNVIRQITASVTFLPLIETSCSFDILMYTNKDFEAPENWDDTTSHIIANPEEVSLRSFSTTIHKVSTSVYYKKQE